MRSSMPSPRQARLSLKYKSWRNPEGMRARSDEVFGATGRAPSTVTTGQRCGIGPPDRSLEGSPDDAETATGPTLALSRHNTRAQFSCPPQYFESGAFGGALDQQAQTSTLPIYSQCTKVTGYSTKVPFRRARHHLLQPFLQHPPLRGFQRCPALRRPNPSPVNDHMQHEHPDQHRAKSAHNRRACRQVHQH